MSKKGNVKSVIISKTLGYVVQKFTENYFASFEKDERIKNAALLTKF